MNLEIPASAGADLEHALVRPVRRTGGDTSIATRITTFIGCGICAYVYRTHVNYVCWQYV